MWLPWFGAVGAPELSLFPGSPIPGPKDKQDHFDSFMKLQKKHGQSSLILSHSRATTSRIISHHSLPPNNKYVKEKIEKVLKAT